MQRKVMSFSIDADTYAKLKQFCHETERQVSWIVRKALLNYFDEARDYNIALKRLMDKKDKVISSKELRKKLGLQH